MYDLKHQHIYVDASIQSKKGMNEHKALVSMIEKSEVNGNIQYSIFHINRVTRFERVQILILLFVESE